MAKYHYEWYTIAVQTSGGSMTLEVKARDKDHAIRQIKKEVEKSSDESIPAWKRGQMITNVLWDTLTLDRIGYHRLS